MVVNIVLLCEIIYHFVCISISKITFLLFEIMDDIYFDGSCTEKSSAIVKV